MSTNYANLFSAQPLDRLEEIYLKTMDVMDDDTLQAYCQTAKYNANLCNDNFWLRRIKERNLELLLPYRSHYSSLMSFYFNVRKDACYIVASIDITTNEDAYAFNDINIARRAFANLFKEEHYINIESNEEINLDYAGQTSTYEIYVLFNNVVLTEQSILPYSIFNLRTDSTNYLNPNISKFPLLFHGKDVLYYTKRGNEGGFLSETWFLSQIGILPFNSKHLRLLPNRARIYYIFADVTIEFDPPFVWTKKDFGIITRGLHDNFYILVDSSILINESKLMVDYRLIALDLRTYSALKSAVGRYNTPMTAEHVAIIIASLLRNYDNKPISELRSLIEIDKYTHYY